jgi:hypothetical protein
MQFRLLDTTPSRIAPDLFGAWETAPGEPASFALPGAPEPDEDVPVWSVNLPSDLTLAATQLEAGLAQVDGASHALGDAQARLDALVKQAQGAGEVSFGAPGAPLPPAEQDLLNALETLRAGESGAVSFGLLPGGPDLAEAEEKFRNVLTRLTQSLAYYAFVETQIEGRLLCRTTLSWSSDSQTLWQSGITAEQLTLHQRTLALAVGSRAALMNTVALTLQSAAKIAALLAVPGGALLALPSAWKFINGVLAEIGQYREALNTQGRA